MRFRVFSIFLNVISAIFLSATASAETFVVSGTVKDTEGEPIPYASVRVESSSIGCNTGADGQYQLNVSERECVVTASAVGYTAQSKTVKIYKSITCDFTLEENAIALNDVNVVGKTGSQRIRESEFAVNALDVGALANSMGSLNDIVGHSTGVKVRRQGGVGADYDLSINGLSGNSVRYFIDGVPLDSKGVDVNLDNIPLNVVERVEVYKGVVPAFLASDALGGAVNIVTRRRQSNYLDASYGIGSFHTHSGDINAQYYLPETSFAIRPTFSINSSKNDYVMKRVEVWDENAGKYVLADRRRFHDDYFSIYSQLEIGVSDVRWADDFFINGNFSMIDKDIQTGAMQNKVYGDATRHSKSWGVGMRYKKSWNNLHTRLNVSHTWNRSENVDTVFRKYSWDGTWMPSSGNEIRNKAKSARVYERPFTVINAGVDYDFGFHDIALNYMMNRCGNHRYDEVDTEFEPSNDVMTKHILALTYSHHFFDERWHNSFFVKNYINSVSIRQKDNATITGANDIVPDATKGYWGGGAGTRFKIADIVSLKASFEHSVRLPQSRELLGNGVTVYPNLALRPESSNNVNAGVFGTWNVTDEHQINYEANVFIRYVHDYIRARVSERDGMMQYQNEPAIDIKGVDFNLEYSWRNALKIAVNGSWNDARDLKKYKSDGNPSATYKNRVPNKPWLYGNVDVSYTFRNLSRFNDRLRIGYAYRWIHWYYLNWEAYGAASSKAKIPAQHISDVDITYSWMNERYNVSLSCDNIFDNLAYDNYMLQKPGRSISAKFRIFIN